MRRSPRPGVVVTVVPSPVLPEAFKDSTIVETCARSDVPAVEDLRRWLSERGLDTSDWGRGSTKTVDKLWQELTECECGLDLWKKPSGDLQLVRVTHVLRAKVCSPESHRRGIFLLNTWQQYSDGRKRVRNGLLSEKLTTSEMPLHKHLHEVCKRAVTQEEMQRVAEALFRITPGGPAPDYDPSYTCPIEVVDEYFNDHLIEVEDSKSYPRLLTMYHLYTVDILCNGLPSVDFTTLEFDHPDKSGHRKLKYVHAWVWKEWSEVQRYLFEGSVLKERMSKGSFGSAAGLHAWLENFNLDLSMWGQRGFKSVTDLFDELEREEAQLEMWGKSDGVPLLMRVVHVLQIKLASTDERLKGKFLYNTWLQTRDGTNKSVNRLMAMKMSTHSIPFDHVRFRKEARTAIKNLLTYFADHHFRFDPDNPPVISQLESRKIEVDNINLVDHHVDVDVSPAFKGLCTLYHLYTVSLDCNGLPDASFASLDVRTEKNNGISRVKVEPFVRNVLGWCWVTWPQCNDIVHSRTRELEEQLEARRAALDLRQEGAEAGARHLDELKELVQELSSASNQPAQKAKECEALGDCVSQLQQSYQELLGSIESTKLKASISSVKRTVPPSIVSELAEKTLVAEDVPLTPGGS